MYEDNQVNINDETVKLSTKTVDITALNTRGALCEIKKTIKFIQRQGWQNEPINFNVYLPNKGCILNTKRLVKTAKTFGPRVFYDFRLLNSK